MDILTKENLLVILMEEAAEVIQSASKCLRFGYDWNEPGYGVNSEHLAREVGDLLAIIHALKLQEEIIASTMVTKLNRVREAHRNRESPI